MSRPGSPDPGAGVAAGWLGALDALAFTSLWAGGVAVALTSAAVRAMQADAPWAVWILAFAGTLVVYNVDRLRDLDRDRETTPIRSAFVERHRRILLGLAAGGAPVAAAAAWPLGPEVWAVCAGAGAVGLLHRRLKGVPIFKGLYIAGAWVVVVVVIPALAADRASAVGWTAAILGAAILGNVIASSVRDSEGAAVRSPRLALTLARVLPLFGLAAAWLGPEAVRPLAWVPAVLLLTLIRSPRGERYGLLVVDGALLVGGVLAAVV